MWLLLHLAFFRAFANRGTEGMPPQYPAANTLLNLYRKSREEEMPNFEIGFWTSLINPMPKIKFFLITNDTYQSKY